MAEVIYLAEGEDHPAFAEDERWITIDASNDGKFYGTGASWKSSGEWVGYCSLCEDDASLEKALAAAQQWAAKYKVNKIWAQLKPWD
ncbi:MAG: hypothetical protein WA793_08985 [Sphingorhabdus sp.]|uniref:hypothetical protein n=1 Tax=Sphingorhabdus sp. TaxID=1902408 RepID=UPI003CB4EE08